MYGGLEVDMLSVGDAGCIFARVVCSSLNDKSCGRRTSQETWPGLNLGCTPMRETLHYAKSIPC
jgi:hypothetical protein